MSNMWSGQQNSQSDIQGRQLLGHMFCACCDDVMGLEMTLLLEKQMEEELVPQKDGELEQRQVDELEWG